MVNFGEVIKCQVEGCEQKAIVRKDEKLYCRYHIPKVKYERKRKWSGYSAHYANEVGWKQRAE